MKKTNVHRCICGLFLIPALLLTFASRGFSQNTTVPVVTIRATDPEASEPGLNTGAFELFRHGPTNLGLHVFLELSGTASNGVDYAMLPNWIPIPAGVRAVPIPVRPIDDNLVEGTETVVAMLVYPPILAPQTYIIGSPSNAVVYILDNDPAPTNRPPWVTIVMPTNGASFAAPVDIPIAAHAGDPDAGDYVATVEFFAGTNSLGFGTSYPYSGSPANLFRLIWSNAPPGTHRLTAKATDSRGAQAVSEPVHIRVEGPPLPPIVTVRATDPHAAEPGVLTVIDSGEFTITRSYGTNVPLTVFFSIGGTASNGVDYIAISNSAVIPAGHLSTRVMVYPRHDTLPEPTETVVLRIQPPACIAIYPPPYECYQVGTPREAVVYIADNDRITNTPPHVRIISPTNGSVFLAPVDIPIVAQAADPDGQVLRVDFFAGDHFVGRDVGIDKGTYSVVWSNALPGFYLLKAKATDNLGAMAFSEPVRIAVHGTNRPPTNLPPVVTIAAVDALAAEGTNSWRWHTNATTLDAATAIRCYGGTNTATFVVRRTGSTNDSLTVNYHIGGTASNGVDYVAIPDSVTIPAGARAARIVITPIDDDLPECVETVVLRLLPETNLPPAYIVGWPSRAAAAIVDNDLPRPTTCFLCDRTFHINLPGADSLCYRVEISHDMVRWLPVCTHIVTERAIHFVDPEAQDFSPRFYRAVPVPCPPAD